MTEEYFDSTGRFDDRLIWPAGCRREPIPGGLGGVLPWPRGLASCPDREEEIGSSNRGQAAEKESLTAHGDSSSHRHKPLFPCLRDSEPFGSIVLNAYSPARQYGDVPYRDTLYHRTGFLIEVTHRVSRNGTSPN